MTTKVVIAAPDNSLFDLIIQSQELDGDDWADSGDPVAVSPHDTAPPFYVDKDTRLVITESARDVVAPVKAEPK